MPEPVKAEAEAMPFDGEERTVDGWALVCLKGDTVPRILDTDLAARLEMPRTRDIRPLIIRHLDALAEIAPIQTRETVSRTSMPRGGVRKDSSDAYFLTDEQAAYIAAKSDMPKATAITIAMVKVFVAWGKGELPTRGGSLTDDVAQIRRSFSACCCSTRAVPRENADHAGRDRLPPEPTLDDADPAGPQ